MTHPRPKPVESTPKLTPREIDDLIAYLIRDPKTHELASGTLLPSYFGREEEVNTVAWVAALDLTRRNGIEDLSAPDFEDRLTTAIDSRLQGADVIDDEVQELDQRLEAMFKRDPSEFNADYGRELLQRFLQERVIGGRIQQLSERIRNGVPEDLGQQIAELQEQHSNYERLSDKVFLPFGNEWEKHETSLAMHRGKDLIGLKTGLAGLDRRTSGLRGVGALGAPPNVGKTALTIQMAVGVCRHHELNDAVVVIISLDMPRKDLYSRIKCNLAEMSFSTLVRGSSYDRIGKTYFNQEDAAKLHDAERKMKEWQIDRRLWILDRELIGRQLGAKRMAGILRQAKCAAGASKALLIIDYLQILPVPDEIGRRQDLEQDRYRVRMVQDVVELTKSADNPDGDALLFISETRKPSSSKEKWGDSLSDFMGSSRLTYAIDYALLYRRMSKKEIQEYYDLKEKDIDKYSKAMEGHGTSLVMLTLEKARDGMTKGSWGLEFQFFKTIHREVKPADGSQDECPVPTDDEEIDDKDDDDADLKDIDIT